MTKAINRTEKGIIIATQEKRVAEWLSEYLTPFLDKRCDLMYATTEYELEILTKQFGMARTFIETDFFGEETIGDLDSLRKFYPELQVILFSISDTPLEDSGRFMWWGGDSFISLRSEPSLIQEQIKAILDGKNTVYEDVLDGIRAYNRHSIRPPHFAPREIEIIRCIAQEKTIKETAKILALSDHTVTNYLCKMYRKCGVNNMVGLVKVGFSVGILMMKDISIPFRPEKQGG